MSLFLLHSIDGSLLEEQGGGAVLRPLGEEEKGDYSRHFVKGENWEERRPRRGWRVENVALSGVSFSRNLPPGRLQF